MANYGKCPLLIDTIYDSIDEYASDLSKSSKRDFKKIYKDKKNGFFDGCQYNLGKFDKERFIPLRKLWCKTRDKIFADKYIDDMEFLYDNGKLLVFEMVKDEEVICIHLVEDWKNMEFRWLQTHPPVFDAEKYESFSLGIYMYYALIDYSIKEKIPYIDLCGGNFENFTIGLKHLTDNDVPYKYKLKFISREVRNFPEKQPKFQLHFCKDCQSKTLFDTSKTKAYCFYC